MIEETEMSFLEHLEVLRWHLVRSAIALILFSGIAFFAKSFVFDYLILSMSKSDFVTYEFFCRFSHFIGFDDKLCFAEMTFNLINISMSGQFMTHVVVSLVVGIIAAFPYILFESWQFIKPALNKNEKSSARGVVFSGTFLFMTGILFGYFVIAPLSVQFLGNYRVSELIQSQISISSYITTVSTIVLACGLIFEMPLIVFFLSKMGILSPEVMKKYRKIAAVVTLIIAAIITPPDITSQILVAIPMLLLYEFSILISKLVLKKERVKNTSK